MLSLRQPSAARRLLALLSLSFVIAVPLLAPEPAAAARPCWKSVLDDWYEGGIGATYPKNCYRSAIRHLPADALLYTNAKDEITAALRKRVLMSSPASAGPAARPATRALARVEPKNATSPPIALIAVASAGLLLLAVGLWQGFRSRGVRRAQR